MGPLDVVAPAERLHPSGEAERLCAWSGEGRPQPTASGSPYGQAAAERAGAPKTARSTCWPAITLPSSTLPRTYCPMQSSQKA